MNLHNSFSVMGFVWLELGRARLWWIALALIAIGSGIAEFVATIAITESGQHRLVFYAAIVRIGAVFVMASLVLTSILREFDDKVVELTLSRPVSRSEWYVGKLLGYCGAGVLFSALVSIPLILQVPAQGLFWCASLMLELMVVIGAALAFAITIRQITLVMCAVAGFYFLARGIAGMALISRGPTVDTSLASNQFVAALVDLLAYVLPDLDKFTKAAWLVDVVPSVTVLGLLAVQALVYLSLLFAVGLFDMHRRNF